MGVYSLFLFFQNFSKIFYFGILEFCQNFAILEIFGHFGILENILFSTIENNFIFSENQYEIYYFQKNIEIENSSENRYIIRNYAILEKIGSGGLGKVYKAISINSLKEYSIKEIELSQNINK